MEAPGLSPAKRHASICGFSYGALGLKPGSYAPRSARLKEPALSSSKGALPPAQADVPSAANIQ